MKSPKYKPSERLKSVLAVGSTEGLFPFLQDWSAEELNALLSDVDAYYNFAQETTTTVWGNTAMRVENVFNRQKSKELDEQRHRLEIELLGMCSEICSVVYFYLSERGIEVEVNDDI